MCFYVCLIGCTRVYVFCVSLMCACVRVCASTCVCVYVSLFVLSMCVRCAYGGMFVYLCISFGSKNVFITLQVTAFLKKAHSDSVSLTLILKFQIMYF